MDTVRLTFAGKLAFSAGPPTSAFLAVLIRRGNPTQYLPAMTGRGAAADFAVTVYALGDGTFRVQMRNLMWIALNPDLGFLWLTSDPAQASALKLSGSPIGETWQIEGPGGYLKVGYYLDTAEPVLTTNLADARESFERIVVTPSAADIARSRAAQNADLTNIVLDEARLPEVDFTKARFTGSSLIDCDLSGSILTRANFIDARLERITLDAAVLDDADMTRATLGPPSWGAPKTAKRLILSGCKAAGAVLGGQKEPLDCSEAALADGDFSGADLRGLVLTRAKAGRAVLVGADLTKAVLDGADLSNAVARRAILRQASMKNMRAQSAIFIGADLSGADLGQAQLGAKAYLFQIASALAADLDSHAYPTEAVIAAFAKGGVTLSQQAPITVIAAGQRWQIADPKGPYLLVAVAGGIDVFLAAPDMTPATMQGALCLGTKASGAGLAGVDLRGAMWFGAGATLDHADLEGAFLSDALCASTDFTQAFLSGADLSGSVLVQASFRACQIGLGAGRQAFSLESAQLQGCNFTNANLLGALLPQAAVALSEGVPLFELPESDKQYLTPSGIATLAPAFQKAGYPLGSTPMATTVQTWLIDNSSDPILSDPRSYLVRAAGNNLNVFDGATNVFYFSLPSSYVSQLSGKRPTSMLIRAFAAAGYGLAETATIAPDQYWTIRAGADAPVAGRFGYRQFTVTDLGNALAVFGSTLLYLRDWPQYPEGLAFAGTNGLQGALSETCIGPSGLPRSWVTEGRLSWLDFLMA
jgi:uncharacterized protein YjbI with pentapeptide repeats